MKTNKADELLDKLKAPLNMMYNNIDTKEMAVGILVYARDKTDKEDDEQGAIRYSFLSKLTRYDAMTIKSILESEINRMSLWLE